MFISIQNIQHIHVSSNKINIVYKPVDSISFEKLAWNRVCWTIWQFFKEEILTEDIILWNLF